MGYDLDFYKKENSELTEQKIVGYLTRNLVQPNKEGNQWLFENKDTEVYFSFELNKESSDDDNEIFDGFKQTNFWFNINFLRPDFFGLEAFNFVNKFIADLELFVLNPQSDSDSEKITKPSENELYENWSKTNLNLSNEYLQNDEFEFYFYPLNKSNEIWTYNFNRQTLQKELGEYVFVPRIFLLKQKSDKKIISVSTWSECIPNVFPKVDYYLIYRDFNKLSKKFKDNGFVSYQDLMNSFENYFEEFSGNKVITFEKAEKAKKTFNDLALTTPFEEFAERIEIEKVLNFEEKSKK